MTAVRNVPLFDKPDGEDMKLSTVLAARQYRLRKDEKAKWADVRMKTYRACEECSAVQHETHGAFGPRRQVKKRRRAPDSPVLELCQAHAQLWKVRDEVDASGKRR